MKQGRTQGGGWVGFETSDESRIIVLPEPSSIWQYRQEISAIIVKKQSRARLLLAHTALHILKTRNVLPILKATISKSTKKRYRLQCRLVNLVFNRILPTKATKGTPSLNESIYR